MVENRSQQQSAQDLAIAAIIALKEQGIEINAVSVARQANLSQLDVTNNPDLMKLIAKEASVNTAGASGLEEERLRTLEEKIAGLQNRNQELHKQVEQALHQALPTNFSVLRRPSHFLSSGQAINTDDRTAQTAPGPSPVESDNMPPNQAVVDLDKIDIFEETDFQKTANSFADKSPAPQLDDTIAGDELRELIQGRIKQAREIQLDVLAKKEAKNEEIASNQANGSLLRSQLRNKFVGSSAKQTKDPQGSGFVMRPVTPEIRKACLILGVRPEELTIVQVLESWKKQIVMPGVHPDLGGDTEAAIYLNTAKDTLIHWIEEQAPKLGKKFGAQGRDATKSSSPPESGGDKT